MCNNNNKNRNNVKYIFKKLLYLREQTLMESLPGMEIKCSITEKPFF